MTDPLITVGITCFAEGDWLLECWNSVLAQTDDRWTAVLVMDGTTHARTIQVFEALEHPKLRKYAMPQNMGPYPTRNKAFELTQTPYHFYLDADDRLLPNAVADVLAAFERFPFAGYVYGDEQTFGSYNEIYQFFQTYSAKDLIAGQHPPAGCAYKKAVWEQLGGFSQEFARGLADFDFHISAFETGIAAIHCGSAIQWHRMGNPGKVSQSYRTRYHWKYQTILGRHPMLFATNENRRRFMARGYYGSADACVGAGQYVHAVVYALRAQQLGRPNALFRTARKIWAQSPKWFVPFGRLALAVARTLKRLGQ